MKKIKKISACLLFCCTALVSFSQTFKTRIPREGCKQISLSQDGDVIHYRITEISCTGSEESARYNLTGLPYNEKHELSIPQTGEYWCIPFCNSPAYKLNGGSNDGASCECVAEGSGCQVSGTFCRHTSGCTLDCGWRKFNGTPAECIYLRADSVIRD